MVNNMSNKKSKKANISLSVNSIVVLVMAMVMLGLGLGFTRSMFGNMSNEFESLTNDIPTPSPSYNEPLLLSSENIISVQGKSDAIKIGIFNPLQNKSKVDINVRCGAFTKMDYAKYVDELESGSSRIISVILEKAIEGNMRICNVDVNITSKVDSTVVRKLSKEFIVEVK